MACNVGPDIVRDGLVLHLDSGNQDSFPRSGSTWYDISSYNRDFTLSGVTYGNLGNGSLIFDGADCGYIDISSISSLKIENFLFSNHSIELWFYITTHSAAPGDSTETNQGLITWPGNHNNISINAAGKLIFTMWNSSRTSTTSNTIIDAVPINIWHHAIHVCDYTNSVWTWYVDGVAVKTSNTVATSSMLSLDGNPANRIFVGAARNSGNYQWFLNDGRISVVKLYNRALSSNEILCNYHALKGRFI